MDRVAQKVVDPKDYEKLGIEATPKEDYQKLGLIEEKYYEENGEYYRMTVYQGHKVATDNGYTIVGPASSTTKIDLKPAASSFTMGNATHARSVSGSVDVKNDFAASIEYLIQILNGNYYENFLKTVKTNWVGADATDFLNDVAKTKADLEKSLRALKTKFNAAIEADQKQFINFQSKNVK